MKLRRITGRYVPAKDGWSGRPYQTIFALNSDGQRYLDTDVPDQVATTTAWLGMTTQPVPAALRP